MSVFRMIWPFHWPGVDPATIAQVDQDVAVLVPSEGCAPGRWLRGLARESLRPKVCVRPVPVSSPCQNQTRDWSDDVWRNPV